MCSYTAVVVFAALFCCSMQLDLPSNVKTCKRSGDDFNGCLKAAIQEALPIFEKGLPEFGLPVLQPFNVPKATVGEGATGAVRVVQQYSDINLYNFTRTTIEKVESTITDTDFKLVISGRMDDFIWKSDYDFNGKILLLPIAGKGKNIAGAKSVDITVTLIGGYFEKKGEKHIKLTSFKIDFNPNDFYVNLENLFNGNEVLGVEMNKLLNSNWKELWGDTKVNYEELFDTILLDYVNRLFKLVPLKTIFPL